MRKKGFTLIELVVVLVILAILVAVALPAFTGARRRAFYAGAISRIDELAKVGYGIYMEQGAFSSDGTQYGYAGDLSDLTTPDGWSFIPTVTGTGGTQTLTITATAVAGSSVESALGVGYACGVIVSTTGTRTKFGTGF